jgi:hypothetical protein
LDSDEPFCTRKTVRTTYAAIWRYSLSQFSVSASQNAPLVAYSPSDSSCCLCVRCSALCSRNPVKNKPTTKMAQSAKQTSDRLLLPRKPRLSDFPRASVFVKAT